MHDCSSQEELGWAEIPWSSTDSDNSSRMRLLPPDHQTYRPTRLLKVGTPSKFINLYNRKFVFCNLSTNIFNNICFSFFSY